MIRKYKKNSILIVYALFVFLFVPTLSFADEGGSGADFGVSVIYPDNQEDKKSGYFDLEVKPKMKQTLEIKVSNYSKKENEIAITSNRSTTSDGGVISYKEYDKKKHEKNPIDFNDVVKLKNENIILKPESSETVEVEIQMPDEELVGELLGGIHFSKVVELTEEEKEKTVVNRFSYSIPILMRQKKDRVPNELSLKKVKAGHRNYHNYIEATIDNSAPSRIREMTVDGSIYKKGEKDIIYSRKEDSYKIAPYSTLKYGFDLQDTELVSGDYELVMLINADGQSYEFKEEFKITQEEAEKFNGESVHMPENKWTPWVWMVIFFLIVSGVITLVMNKKKKVKKNKNKKTKKYKKRNRIKKK